MNGNTELDLHVSWQKINKWRKEVFPGLSKNDSPPSIQSEEAVHNTNWTSARDYAQQRTSHHRHSNAPPDLQERSKRQKRSRDEAHLSSDLSDHARRPGREGRPPRDFDPSHRNERYQERRGYTGETGGHRPSKEKRRRKEASSPVSDDGSNSETSPRRTSPRRTPCFEKAVRHKTRDDRYDTHREADKKRRHPAKQKGDSPSKGKHSHKHMPRVELPVGIMAKFKSDNILGSSITLKRPGPGMFGTYKSSRRPVADLDFHEMNFLKRNAEGAQNNPLSASRARERRREDRIGEEVSAFFREAHPPNNHHIDKTQKAPQSGQQCQSDRPSQSDTSSFRGRYHGGGVRAMGLAANERDSSPSRESPYPDQSDMLRRLKLLEQMNEKAPKSLTPSSISKRHLGQPPAGIGALSMPGPRNTSSPDMYRSYRDVACGMTHQGPPTVTNNSEGSTANPPPCSQPVGYRDQGVMVDQSLEAKGPPPLQSSVPARAAGNDPDGEASLRGLLGETACPSMPVEGQQYQEPPTRPVSPKWYFEFGKNPQKRANGLEFPLPDGASQYRDHDEVFPQAEHFRYPPPAPRTSDQHVYQRPPGQAHQHEPRHLATEPDSREPRQLFSGASTRYYESHTKGFDQPESTAMPSPLLGNFRVGNPGELPRLDEQPSSWAFLPRASSTTHRVGKYQAMAQFISDHENEVYSKGASEYGLDPAARDGLMEANKYDSLEFEVSEQEKARRLASVPYQGGRDAPQFMETELPMADFWRTNPFLK
ncbi:hypothetical protein GGTG_01843 [Gaeumannomyces tritici R3-111a-1]|uniref:Uncharacterized protein n=1 Tax=Gaeumannomyces tritici (strain R3-111a-1) TaxID=644352 RepID=J3NKQ2_GAET3|nr:hypothetical protein GGTG_01843 [Gaeumannomyces tritici R3-111a-1]EJT81869.1 hypothetical protein GGTG_01843 [Gaeumannomyces tritici R3-111a-1]